MAEIDVTSLEPNSHKYKAEKAREEAVKQEKKKITPVVTRDQVVSTKKPLRKKFAETFLSDDVTDIKTWLIQDVLIPGAQKTILNIISMMFFGEVVDRGYGFSRSRRDRDERTDYRSSYRGSSDRRDRSRRRDRYESDDRVDFRNIVLRERRDAEEIIDRLRDRIEDSGSASIADLLDMVDATSRYTDNNWGWKDRRDIGIRRVANGFLIDVAEPEYLD